MSEFIRLDEHLEHWAAGDPNRAAVATAVEALAAACRDIAAIVAAGAIAGPLSAFRGDGIGGDVQKELDLRANDLILDALQRTPVAAVLSEEMDVPRVLGAGAPLLVAVDPLDGSSNIDANVSVGTIFSLLRAPAGGGDAADFLQPGTRQIAAGYAVYGPQTSFVLTCGEGTDIFTLDRRRDAFVRTGASVLVPHTSSEFAINASNYRHWDPPFRVWFDDCIAGCDGPRGQDFNMRWIASMVAEAHRILTRGGVYAYPRDARRGYDSGRLRLLYEANPIAMLMEQAGAAASTGRGRMLDHAPRMLHERVPLIFGSRQEVERIERHHVDPQAMAARSPLFGRRGLFL
jgi:fructose-1,6-bisphosphatase I